MYVRRSGRIANISRSNHGDDDEEVIDLTTPEWDYAEQEINLDDLNGHANGGNIGASTVDGVEAKDMEKRKAERVIRKEKLKALAHKRLNNHEGVGGDDEKSKKRKVETGKGKKAELCEKGKKKNCVGGYDEKSKKRKVETGNGKKAELCEKGKKKIGVGKNGNIRDKNVLDGNNVSSDDDFVDNFGTKDGISNKKMEYATVKPAKVAKKKKDLDRIHLKNPPCLLFKTITNLNSRQKQDVRDIGFGDLLDFKIKSVPKRLAYWLLDKFDAETCSMEVNNRRIVITADLVRKLLGVPMGEVHIDARKATKYRNKLARKWKKQFGDGFMRLYNSHVSNLIKKGRSGWMFKINFLVLFFSTVGELNLSNTVNLKFIHCINREEDILKLDWCTYILECLIKTKKSWKRDGFFNGPIILLLVLYAHSEIPIKIWSSDMLNKLEADLFDKDDIFDKADVGDTEVEASDEEIVSEDEGDDDVYADYCSVPTDLEGKKKYVSACLKKAAELVENADEVLDEELSYSPLDSNFIELKELRDQLFAVRTYSQQTKDCPDEEENDQQPKNYPDEVEHGPPNYFCTPDSGRVFQVTRIYGSPTGYGELQDKVWKEWHKNDERIPTRLDFDEECAIDLNVTQPPATQGKVVGGEENGKDMEDDEALAEEDEFFTPEQTIGAREKISNTSNKTSRFRDDSLGIVPAFSQPQPLNVLQGFPSGRVKRRTILAEVLRSPYVIREVSVICGISPHENKAAKCFFSAHLKETDIVFKTSYADGQRTVLETLYPGVEIASGAIDLFTHVLNEAEKSANINSVKRIFCHTAMVTDDMKKWNYDTVAEKFIQNMDEVVSKSIYKTTHGIELVFFPILIEKHFILMCMNVKAGLVQIFDNISSTVTDVQERYGPLPLLMVGMFWEYMLHVNHPCYDKMLTANIVIMQLGCNTKNNFVDCGVFVMRHMETFKGNGDCCGLSIEGEEQKKELKELRIKYVAKILLAECNQLKKEFEQEVHDFRKLTNEEKKEYENGALKRIMKRVTEMMK